MIKNKKMEKFLCEWYTTNEGNDVTLFSFISGSISYGIVIAIVLAILVGVFCLFGIGTQMFISGESWTQPYGEDAMFPECFGVVTFFYGLATVSGMILIILIVDKVGNIKLAHCKVKDDKKIVKPNDEENEQYNN